MSEILIGCIVIIALGIISIFGGIIAKAHCYDGDGNGFIGIGIAVIILDIVFGFFMVGNGISVKEQKTILMPDEIAKSQYTLFVKCEGRQFESTEARFVMASNDLIRVEKKEGINSYNNVCETSYVLVLSDGGSK